MRAQTATPSPVTLETGKIGTSRERGAGQQRPTSACACCHALGRYRVDLGQRHGAAAQTEQIENLQMLARLRHRPVVGRYDQQHVVDAGCAGQHVVQELLVPGHVDEAEHAAGGSGV